MQNNAKQGYDGTEVHGEENSTESAEKGEDEVRRGGGGFVRSNLTKLDFPCNVRAGNSKKALVLGSSILSTGDHEPA